MAFDVSSIFAEAQPKQELQSAVPRTAETIGSEIRYLSHQAKGMTVWFGVEIGRRLAEAKSMVGHGGWLDFLRNETEFSQPSANRFMRIAKEYGGNANQSALNDLSVTNALRLLAVPAEEREEFAEAVDAENLSARELEQAIRERDEARKALEEERAAGEGAALKLGEVAAALDAEREKAERLRERTEAQAEKILELENRPVEVAVQAPDPAEIEKAVNVALADAEKKHAAAVADLEKRRKEAQKKQTELQAEAAKLAADLKNRSDREDELNQRVKALQAELEEARANAAKLQKAEAIQSDADVAVFQSFFQAVQENFNRACGLMQKVKARDADKASKLARFSRDALARMSALIEKEA